jgi:anhydro-N-acetylmuramic acid kinase
MTSAIQFPAHIVGLMSGTSADGVDAALLYTDGDKVVRQYCGLFVPYSDALRQGILDLMQDKGDIAAVTRELTFVHIEAVRALIKQMKIAPRAVGFHGQTILHAPKQGITVQIGDAPLMARELGVPVVADFRSNDVRNGGQGAPLVPLYHAALASSLPKPLMVVNIGGVSNVTWIGEDKDILAFDCGPGNALLDDWVHQHTGARYDKDGALAAQGTVNEALLTTWMTQPFFSAPVPKSLDRNQFHGVIPSLAELSAADGAATLAAFTAEAIARAVALAPQRPAQLLITGGGRHNPTLMRMIEARVNAVRNEPRVASHGEPRSGGGLGVIPPSGAQAHIKIAPVESVGWNGDMLEAEAFAYLAARSILELPLSLPSTTGVNQPVTGGVFYPAGCVDAS